jgi:hypothetical protein
MDPRYISGTQQLSGPKPQLKRNAKKGLWADIKALRRLEMPPAYKQNVALVALWINAVTGHRYHLQTDGMSRRISILKRMRMDIWATLIRQRPDTDDFKIR